jgi:SNF2 family DNA or RNA helicase
MLSYDIIIVSYSFVMSRYRKADFLPNIALFKRTSSGIPPNRPNISIFSELFNREDGIKFLYLILDEVNAAKNPKSLTFAAVSELRRRSDICLMLTGSPIDDAWPE